MPREFEPLKDGDALEPYHLNMIYEEIRRLRRMRATPPLILQGMASSVPPSLELAGSTPFLLRVTDGPDGDGLYDWVEVLWDGDAGDYEESEIGGTAADGDGARELNDRSVTPGETVYQAWRDNFGVVCFELAVGGGTYWNAIVTTTAITACSGTTPGAGKATLYSWNGSSMDSGDEVDVRNWFSGSAAIGKHIGISLGADGVYWLTVLDC